MPRRGPPPSCGRRCKRKKSGEGDPPVGAAEEDGGGVDRINQLPEGVLGDIISLLPTKDGARTRILASRWRHIWLSAPLNLDCRDLAAAYSNVPGVVSHILSTHQGPVRRLCVKRYRLPPAATVDAWLQSAALNGLEELEFWLDMYILLNLGPLPASIYRFSPTLRVATIGGCRLPDDAVAQGRLHFPSLKQLSLEYGSISECSLHSLIASCPALECLLMYSSFGCRRLRINSLSLTSICVQTRDPVGLYELVLQDLIIENAPCLEKLIPLYFFRGLRVSVISAPRLNTLGFLTDWNADWNDCSTKLALGSTVIRGLRTDSLLTMAVHTVKILAVNMAFLSLDNAVDMMRLFPCLEKLYVKSGISGEKNLWQHKYRSLITCFDIRLKTVVLEPYLGTWSQVNFAKFFVLNARVLELMTFHVDANSYNEEFLAEQRRKLQLENKTSRDARFHFTTGTCLQAVWETKHLSHFNFYDPFVCTC